MLLNLKTWSWNEINVRKGIRPFMLQFTAVNSSQKERKRKKLEALKDLFVGRQLPNNAINHNHIIP